MQNTKFYATLLVLVIFVGIFSISPAISSLMNGVVVGSTGEILTGAYARSGSARDIQAAVDWVAEHGGIGNVYIPEGTFNFVEVGEPWMTVNIPVGVNLFGVPTERDANDQVMEWKTVLVMPYEVPTTGSSDRPDWFFVQGNGSPDVSFRFSDIKLVGWRFFDNSSTTMYTGLRIYHVQNFRVDHSNFQDLAGSGIWLGSEMKGYNRDVISGVIDHNRFTNNYGDPGFMRSTEATVGYGIGMRRWASDVWEPDIANVVGKYNNYTVVIEDNYFTKWRHATSSNDGIHQIVRHNIFEGGYGISEVDGHGSYADDIRFYAVGTRAMEVYENIFKNPDRTWMDNPWAINVRGGSAIIFNNTLEDYYGLLDLNNDWGNYEPYRADNFINQTYIWNNDLGGGTLIHYNSGCVENVNYFLRAPNLEQDGFEYTPYPYPHPLTLEETP